MYTKNMAYTEKIINLSIDRLTVGSYTFRDIENIYLALMKRFILEPTAKNDEEWYKFQLNYVPFNKQELSPEFVNNVIQILDILEAKRNYKLFDIAQTRIISLLSAVSDMNNCIKILEKDISFFSNEPVYNWKVEEYKKDLRSMRIFNSQLTSL